MDGREMRGMQIAATMPLRRDAKGWIVPSQSGPGTYRVVPAPTTTYKVAQGLVPPPPGVQPWGCNCPDFETRGQPCKHVFAVELVVRRQTVDLDGTVLTQEMKVTYTQDWTAYNAAQTEEKERFRPMLADLCSTLQNPPRGRGRPRMPISDMAFASVLRVYEGLSALPLKGVETDFAVDSTGFTTSRFARWFDHKWGKEQTKREWVKLHAMTGVRTNIVTSVELTDWRGADYNYFRPLLASTAENFAMRDVTADKAYSGRPNLQAVTDLGAVPYIPFRAHRVGGIPAIHDPNAVLPGIEASAWVRMYHLFVYQRDTFLAHYHKRSNVETTFSMIKRKFGDALRSKSDVGQMNEVLCKVIAHNLCVLIACIHELGLAVPEFGTTNCAELVG